MQQLVEVMLRESWQFYLSNDLIRPLCVVIYLYIGDANPASTWA